MDRELKAIIGLNVQAVLKEFFGTLLTEEEKSEQWLTADELATYFHWAPSWMQRNGQFLPRRQPQGGGFLYPRNQIQRMFKDGSINELRK